MPPVKQFARGFFLPKGYGKINKKKICLIKYKNKLKNYKKEIKRFAGYPA
jgi:hypothetical protein